MLKLTRYLNPRAGTHLSGVSGSVREVEAKQRLAGVMQQRNTVGDHKCVVTSFFTCLVADLRFLEGRATHLERPILNPRCESVVDRVGIASSYKQNMKACIEVDVRFSTVERTVEMRELLTVQPWLRELDELLGFQFETKGR
jgi:hypothetical protein